VSISEAASYLGVPRAQLLRWAQQSTGPKFVGHPLRPDRMEYSQQDLDNWLEMRHPQTLERIN